MVKIERRGLEIWETSPRRINATTAGTCRVCIVDEHLSEGRFEEDYAALFTAAPDMLVALKAQVAAHELLCRAANLDEQAHIDGTAQARAAIAKAETV